MSDELEFWIRHFLDAYTVAEMISAFTLKAYRHARCPFVRF
ncbi:MAG: hypothetical protein RMK32_04440 [Anaerolineae bacterium]|nr:hypothetical protein [Anaerolineae bacterium]